MTDHQIKHFTRLSTFDEVAACLFAGVPIRVGAAEIPAGRLNLGTPISRTEPDEAELQRSARFRRAAVDQLLDAGVSTAQIDEASRMLRICGIGELDDAVAAIELAPLVREACLQMQPSEIVDYVYAFWGGRRAVAQEYLRYVLYHAHNRPQKPEAV